MGAADAAGAVAAEGPTRGAKQGCGSMQQDEECDGQHDKSRRRRERNTEAHSERAGKRKAREEQHGARKKAKRTNETNSPLGAHTHPREGGGGGGGGAGGAVAAKAEPEAYRTVTWALRGFRSVREHCVVAL
jgi:hypothetical protein